MYALKNIATRDCYEILENRSVALFSRFALNGAYCGEFYNRRLLIEM